ncbi:MAG: YkgJ family cysteine cluster protein [Desulfosarcina sp.]|nr:YkgJ family cysteine cluster protein [Desulfobacterales bacterium]
MMSDFIPISIKNTFNFSCNDDLACFNQCCRDLNQFLTPYDILRIKKNLDMPSDIFLGKYTTEHYGPETGLPVISLKADSDDGLKCPFVTSTGCRIYKDRPSSCRMYPLARGLARSRETGILTEHYMILKEDHCKGFRNGQTRTVEQWIADQGIAVYNRMNDMLLEIISMKNRLMPGPLDIKSRLTFHTACYNLDIFRKHIFENGIMDHLDLNPETLESVKSDDTMLLELGLQWIKYNLFGDRNSTAFQGTGRK